jgi:large conductance mechanosensitive channel
MSLLKEFQKFAVRGNLIDLAVGFTVGAAFTTVVKSLVSDVLMPPIGLLTGGADFADLFWVLKSPPTASAPAAGFATLADAQNAGAVTLNYGLFLNNCLALFLVALAMFAVIRTVNRLDARLEAAFGETPPPPGEPAEKKCEYCRSNIPYRATRCPHCTSELRDVPSSV